MRSDEIDGNLVVMSGAGVVRPHSFVRLALDTTAGTTDTCGVSWWQSGSESLLTSLLGTSLLGRKPARHLGRAALQHDPGDLCGLFLFGSHHEQLGFVGTDLH